MNARRLFILAVVFSAVLYGPCRAISSGIGQTQRRAFRAPNPIGSATVPPSGISPGLIGRTSPIGAAGRSQSQYNTFGLGGSAVITDDLVGSRRFRGVVPYGSGSDFISPVGSSPLDSFLRRSVRRLGYGLRVTSDERLPPSGLETSVLASPAKGPGSYGCLQPSLMSLREPDREISAGVGTYPPGRMPAGRVPASRKDQEQFRQEPRQVRESAAELEKSLTGQPLRPQELLPKAETVPAGAGLVQPAPEVTKGVRGLDVYEQMRQQIYSFEASPGRVLRRKGLEQLAAMEAIEQAVRDDEQASEESYRASVEQLEERPLEIYREKGYRAGAYRPESYRADRPAVPSPPGLADRGRRATLSASPRDSWRRARGILGSHKTFASFSKDKFNQHLRLAEEYLKQGRYYRAADTYTLASIYKPGDPLAYAGKSHALFAAGEYVSSALFLSRALEIFPEYARFKIELEYLIGDRGTIESRIADIKRWQERSDSADLQFLLGYICYQMGRLGEAKEFIDAAHKRIPEAPAVDAVKKAVDDAVGSGFGKTQGPKP